MRGGAFFNGKEGRDDFRKTSLWLKGDGGIRKISYNIKFKLVLLNQYPGKNPLKAIINKVAPMGERNDFRTRISRIL